MKQGSTQPSPMYVKPTIEVLGSFATLTQGGGKTSAVGDMHAGWGHSGPGS